MNLQFNKKADEDKVVKYLEKFLKDQNVAEYVVNLKGTSEKGENYVSDIKFVDVKTIGKDGAKKNFQLVIKQAKSNEKSRQTLPIRMLFGREVYIYTKIMPFFHNFENEKGFFDHFIAAPKCYQTSLTDCEEFLILDNLKAHGYELHDRRIPLSLYHMKLVLEQYGKWHALSFAARDQKNQEINQLTQNWPNVFENALKLPGMDESFNKAFANVFRILEENNELLLLQKIKDDFKEGAHSILLNISGMQEPNWVVVHGDCWINNFMFKYSDSNETTPIRAVILDWQTSYRASPARDLVYFIYATAAGKQLQHLNELLKTYYQSLSSHIEALGSNPKDLFPIDEFEQHWNKHVKFGLSFIPFGLQVQLSAKEDNFSIDDLTDNQSFANTVSSIKTNKAYDTRMLEIIRQHYSFKFDIC